VSQQSGTPEYGSDGYGGRAEVFVTGFGLFTRQAIGNATSGQTIEAGGSAGYRLHVSSSSSLEGRYGFSRTSQRYTTGGTVSSIPAYLSEISGSYVYSFAKSRRIQPFVEGGGGLVLFSPSNYTAGNYTGGTATSSAGAQGGSGFGYGVLTDTDPNLSNVTVYSGTPSGAARQAKGMFLYGAGADLPASSHLHFRFEFRGLGYKAPDFGLAALHTNAFNFAYEPSVGIAFRF
jgi:hypothetical protein